MRILLDLREGRGARESFSGLEERQQAWLASGQLASSTDVSPAILSAARGSCFYR